MSIDYVASGRSAQKARTAELLLATARRLIENGDTPRIEDVAEASGISRTTAYRYFRTQAELLAAAFPETATVSMLPSPPPADVGERVRLVVQRIIEVVAKTEDQQRAMLRLSLGETRHELPLRQGRAIGWLREALEPLAATFGDDALLRLAIALRSVCGIETRVWLSDIAHLNSEEVGALQLWAAEALLARATECPPPDALPAASNATATT